MLPLRGQIAGHAGPRLAVVGGLEEVRLPVVVPMVVDRDVRCAGIEMRRLDARDLRVALGRAGDIAVDVGERLAAILAHLQIAIFRADPDHAGTRRRFAHLRGQRTGGVAIVLLRHRLVAGDAHDGHVRPTSD